MNVFYKIVNKRVLISKRMFLIILILLSWFISNGFVLQKIFNNPSDIRIKSILEVGAFFVYDKLFSPNVVVLVIIPSFILLLDNLANYFLMNEVIIRFKNTNQWWKNYYKSLI